MGVAGVIGTALTADVGARKVREEIDAMMVMGIDPVRDLAVPRVLSITFLTPLLAVPSLSVTILSMRIGATYVADMPASNFHSNLFSTLAPVDILLVLVNSVLIVVMTGHICCVKGLTACGGHGG